MGVMEWERASRVLFCLAGKAIIQPNYILGTHKMLEFLPIMPI